MNKLYDKVIVVTGGNGLIGKSILKYVEDAGAIAVNAELNVSENLDNGLIDCDITSSNSIQVAVEKILKKYNRIDGWVNNAYPRTKDWGNKFEDISIESWKQNVDMQLNSIFACCQQVLKIMKSQKNGSIVNISSIYGTVGPDFSLYEGTEMTMPAAYSAIKGGIVSFSRYLASYYGPYGIRINCVSPGGIIDNQPDIFIQNYNAKVPMGRMGIPDDISPAVSFLLSDDSAYITGQNIIIDGGWTCI
jgi:NAD(P)-dependent dehydrogenase (short-subunit alcohol dehydrogenase family)